MLTSRSLPDSGSILFRLIIIFAVTGVTRLCSADCNCQSSAGSFNPAASPTYSPFGLDESTGLMPGMTSLNPPVMQPGSTMPGLMTPGAMPAGGQLTGAGLGYPAPFANSSVAALPVNPGHNRFDVSPPPGTLGRTYQQRSRLLEEDEHPRIGKVEVRLPEEVDVSARGLKSTWTGEVWILESKDPLVPGLPHVYAVKAERRDPQGKVVSTDVRWVRLIMGRVVELDFK